MAAVAVGRRAHRLAFAMMRDGMPYEPGRWTKSVVGKAVMVNIEVHQNDVPCPPVDKPEGKVADLQHLKRSKLKATGRRKRSGLMSPGH